LNFLDIFSENVKNIEFHENPFIGSRVGPWGLDGWTGRHDEANSSFSQFYELA